MSNSEKIKKLVDEGFVPVFDDWELIALKDQHGAIKRALAELLMGQRVTCVFNHGERCLILGMVIGYDGVNGRKSTSFLHSIKWLDELSDVPDALCIETKPGAKLYCLIDGMKKDLAASLQELAPPARKRKKWL